MKGRKKGQGETRYAGGRYLVLVLRTSAERNAVNLHGNAPFPSLFSSTVNRGTRWILVSSARGSDRMYIYIYTYTGRLKRLDFFLPPPLSSPWSNVTTRKAKRVHRSKVSRGQGLLRRSRGDLIKWLRLDDSDSLAETARP